MKRLIIIILISIGIIFSIPCFVFAVNEVQVIDLVYFELNTSDASPSLSLISTPAGGLVTQLYIETDYIDVTLDNASTLTLDTTIAGQYLQITKQSGSDDYTLSPSCITNHAIMTGTGATAVLRVRVVSTAPACSVTTPPSTPPVSGGGGGGGGGTNCYNVINPSLTINNGAESTNSRNVSLNLSAANAAQVAVSEDPAFLGGSFQSISSPLPFSLSEGSGLKTVYALFRNNCSTILTKAIIKYEPGAATPKPAECVELACTDITYDLYIINPNGTERHMNTNYTKTKTLADGTTNVYFEDSGSDFDYNDLVLNVNKKDCNNITVSNISIDAGWHHQVKMKLYYNGVFKDDVLLWSDSHQSVTASKSFSAYSSICQPLGQPIVANEPAAGLCTVQSAFTIPLGPNMIGTTVRTLQELLQCLGYFPKDQPSTAIYSTVTAEAVSKFQSAHNLSQTGIADKATLDELNKYVAGAVVSNQPVTPPIITPFTPPENQPGAVTPPSAVTEPAAVTCTLNSQVANNLALNSVSASVRNVQDLLRCLGYFPSTQSSTAFFGPITSEAVKKFQTEHNLAQTGIVDTATKNELNKYLTPVATLPSENVPNNTCNAQCKDITYDLYIINPNGTERHMNTRYARITPQSNGTVNIAFEDSTDFNYRDVILNVDKKDCNNVTISNVLMTASWHHQVRMKLYYSGVFKNDVLLWADDHESVGNAASFSAFTSICPASSAQNFTEPPALSCRLVQPFTQTLTSGNVNSAVRSLQDLLRCLGYFPSAQSSTAIFGPITKAALIKFQAYHSLAQTGSVDLPTMAELNKFLPK